jgi:hypothetical protein
MKPRIPLRRALEDKELLGSCLGGDSWHSWRSILLAAMGEPLKQDEAASFKFFTGRETAPDRRAGKPPNPSKSAKLKPSLQLASPRKMSA